jgi:hypothetical protein
MSPVIPSTRTRRQPSVVGVQMLHQCTKLDLSDYVVESLRAS